MVVEVVQRVPGCSIVEAGSLLVRALVPELALFAAAIALGHPQQLLRHPRLLRHRRSFCLRPFWSTSASFC